MQNSQTLQLKSLNLANNQTSRWHSFNSQDEINQATVKRILQAAKDAIEKHGSFLIVLAGGSTPKSVYQLLAKEQADWGYWHIYHNDDRCLPVDHTERNSKMAREAWLNHVAIPQRQIHDIPAELGNIEGAKAYAKTLTGVRTFDMVILGLGEDGHTASLFPNQSVDNSADAVPVFNSPKPPTDRITLSQNRLNDTHEVIFIVTGAGKQEAVEHWRKGVAIPATLIAPSCGVDVYCFGVKL
ncbi:MAG: 6-phosphogluconolactonase [Methylotenera sp.]|nr:6-phosphogluconolactonase [Methylotenera sp.]MDO9232244.1 6-phosphogluconolactonase [Methylotenera sp.]MDO9388068.1 6-phosphogluconolactonase [Methylotenera sp.]MDP2102226.1 6-phosphogluconolactonase [Methylotenera sp.]MDP2281186.1 6-phosphogluconolactonase [Methylotenera sp.]